MSKLNVQTVRSKICKINSTFKINDKNKTKTKKKPPENYKLWDLYGLSVMFIVVLFD